MRERLVATIHGAVQGVGFRWFVMREADRRSVTGWTANEPAGSVTVVAEGEARALDELLALLREGPPGAQVYSVDERRLPPTGEFGGFSIRAVGHSGD